LRYRASAFAENKSKRIYVFTRAIRKYDRGFYGGSFDYLVNQFSLIGGISNSRYPLQMANESSSAKELTLC